MGGRPMSSSWFWMYPMALWVRLGYRALSLVIWPTTRESMIPSETHRRPLQFQVAEGRPDIVSLRHADGESLPFLRDVLLHFD